MRRIGRVGRPGLLETAARTAVFAGTATAVSGAVAKKQRAATVPPQAPAPAQPQPAPTPVAPVAAAAVATAAVAGPGDGLVEQLERLGGLLQQGLLTPEEFAGFKQQLLNG